MASPQLHAHALPALMVRYWNDRAEIVADEVAHEIGGQGIFVRTDAAPKPGTLLQFELCVDGEDPPLCGVVRVTARREPRPGASEPRAGMGVKFVFFDAPDDARFVLDRIHVKATPSVLPPPIAEPLDEHETFFAAPQPPVRAAISIEDELGIVDARAVRERDPHFHARRRALRRVVAGVLGGAALLAGIAAARSALRPTATSADSARSAARDPPARVAGEGAYR